jgi:tRNA(adenine34) deaminase
LKNRWSDEEYMHKALEYAQKAAEEGEVPIGALVVDSTGAIIGVGYNQVEQNHTQTAHAEMQALREAAVYRGDWRLENCFLYVTLEPCTMCNGAARLSRLEAIIFGAQSNLFGCHLDKDSFVPLYTSDTPFFKGGVCEKECIDILKMFFKRRREQRDQSKRT